MLEPIWPERFETIVAEHGDTMRHMFKRPNTAEIDADIAKIRAIVAKGEPWLPPETIMEFWSKVSGGLTFGDYDFLSCHNGYATDPADPWVFHALPCVQEYLTRVRTAEQMHITAADDSMQHEYQILHTMYLFKKSGKRVYVLDQKLYDLFKYTALPAWDFSTLRFPYTCFYIKFPPKAFFFDIILNPMLEMLGKLMGEYSNEAQEAEGAFVRTYYNTDGSVEFGMMITGKSRLGPGDDNLAHVQTGIGPHAKLTEIKLKAPDGKFTLGSEKLDNEVPHVILSLMLYLASEHPDIVPVEAPRPRKFTDIRSPREREAALKREAEKYKNVSRLSYLHVGPRLRTLEQRKAEFEAATGRTLTRGVMVGQDTGGFWKRQPYGPKNELRKIIHIAPFWRGPDYAEEMAIRAAKVQTGELRKKTEK